jgi:beta-glucosidase
LLPLDKSKIKSIAVIGPRANEVLFDWYSGRRLRRHAASRHQNKVGPGVTVNCATNNDHGGREAGCRGRRGIVCVGNHPTGDDTQWAKVALPSDGREAVDRKSITLEDEELIKQFSRQSQNRGRVGFQFSLRHQLDAGARSGHCPHDA